MYPRLEINIDKLKTNVRVLHDLCQTYNIDMAMVTKSYCAIPEVVEELTEQYVDYIADSRIENLKNISHIKLPKILLRVPMLSEVEEVIKYADISFNSELKIINALNEEAKKLDTVHKVVIMVDLGDLREGYFKEEDLFNAVEEVLTLSNIELYGIATNLTCYGAIIPSYDNLGRLSNLAKEIENKYKVRLQFVSGGNSSSIDLMMSGNMPDGITNLRLGEAIVLLAKEIENKYKVRLQFVSGGNSSSIDLMMSGNMPDGITNLRLGEAIVLGRETAYGKNLEGTYQDAFKLICEIVELKEKPSLPIGEVGVDAFGNKPVYEDKGIIKRAIIGIGKQDIDITSIHPIDSQVEILGASSDHMILNMSGCNREYCVGDKVEFLVEYGGLVTACTSKYVRKKVIYSSELAY